MGIIRPRSATVMYRRSASRRISERVRRSRSLTRSSSATSCGGSDTVTVFMFRVLIWRHPTRSCRSDPLEIGAFGDGEALEVAAQAVEAELDRAEAHPVAAAIDAGAAGFDAVLGGDREIDAAAEIDTVGAVIDFDQHGESMAGAGFLARRSGHLLGRLAAQFAGDQRAVEAERGGDFGGVAGDEAAAEHLLRTGQMGDAGGDLAGGEGLDDRQRPVPLGEARQHDPFERLIVFPEDE